MKTQKTQYELRFQQATELRFVDAVDGAPPRLSGYAATYNTLSNPLGMAGKRFVEQIAPGAFRSALNALATGENAVLQIEHSGLALADTATRTLRLAEDQRGLSFEADLDPSDPDVQRILPKIRRGTLRAMSFRFQVAPGGDAWDMRDGKRQRTLTNIGALRDVSLVTEPAYPDTSMALRSLTQWEQANPEARATIDTEDDQDAGADEALEGDQTSGTTPANPNNSAKYAIGQRVIMTAENSYFDKGQVGDIAGVYVGAFYRIDLGGYQVWVPENQLQAVEKPTRSLETSAARRRLRLREMR